MRKIILIAMASMVAVSFSGCKTKGEYADLKEYLGDMIKIQEEYVAALEKANSAKDVAEAMNDFGDKMEKINEDGREISRKYSDLGRLRKENPPELKEEFERMKQVAQKLLEVSLKTMKYMMDPEVLKASQEMTKKAFVPDLFK